MVHRSAGIAAAVLLMALVGFSQTAVPAMKGHELYSWKVKNHWHYALLLGTNRTKTVEEITAKQTERVGMAALKGELRKLQRGEKVMWLSAAPGTTRQRVGTIVLRLPSRHRINRVRAYCEKLGLELSLH